MSARIEPPIANATILETLGMVGDGDDLDLVRDLENAFAVKFSDAEIKTWATAGNVRDTIERCLQAHAGQDNIRCMNAMAYHALRQTLMSVGANRRIPLSARLDRYFPTPKDLAVKLKRQTGLSASLEMGWLGSVGALMILAGIALLAMALLASLWWKPLASLTVWTVFVVVEVAGVLALRFDRRSYDGCETVAEAVAMLARENFGVLAKRGGRFTPESVWQTVRQIVARSVGLQPDSIGSETLLLEKR